MLKSEVQDIYMKRPQYGYRKVALELNSKGIAATCKITRRIMNELGLTAIYPKPRLSKAKKEHKKYPYLLRNLKIDHANQVWATDITYIRLPGGYVYLASIMDIFSRRILSWRISNSLDNSFCIEALNEALVKYGKPEIFNSDQGSQFTSCNFVKILLDRGIDVSMDGKGRAIDNVYIERFWRTIKYEDIHIKNYQSIAELKKGVEKYIEFYNSRRWHQGLNYSTPDVLYYGVA
jgi:putative transposase